MTPNIQKIINDKVKEFSRMKARKERTINGRCATCGRTENHNEITELGRFTHQFDAGVDAIMWNEIDFILSSLQEVHRSAYNQALEDVEGEAETKKKKHRVFECDGTQKYESWCEDVNCPSEDNVKVKRHNQTLSDITKFIQSKKENL